VARPQEFDYLLNTEYEVVIAFIGGVRLSGLHLKIAYTSNKKLDSSAKNQNNLCSRMLSALHARPIASFALVPASSYRKVR